LNQNALASKTRLPFCSEHQPDRWLENYAEKQYASEQALTLISHALRAVTSLVKDARSSGWSAAFGRDQILSSRFGNNLAAHPAHHLFKPTRSSRPILSAGHNVIERSRTRRCRDSGVIVQLLTASFRSHQSHSEVVLSHSILFCDKNFLIERSEDRRRLGSPSPMRPARDPRFLAITITSRP
jgi:hypothetical protein